MQDFLFQPSVELLPNAKSAAMFVPDSSTVFREDTRHESAIVTTDTAVFATLFDEITDLVKNKSVPLSELYNAQIKS